jgi:peptide/nickel transport system substrate-binding protein
MTTPHAWKDIARSRTSRRRLLRAGAFTGAGLAGAALIGCGDEDEPTPTATATLPPASTSAPGTSTPAATPTQAASGPRQGGSLRLNVQSGPADSWNMVTNTNMGNYVLTQHVYDTLFSPRVGRDRNDSLEAAESVEVPDDLTIVFTLKEGLVYQDKAPANGRPVVSEDIKTYNEYVRDNDAAIDRSFLLTVVDNIETPDDRTIIYHMQRPYAYSFSTAGFGYPHNNAIIPSELTLGNLEQDEPVGSGPYQLANFQHQVEFAFERNPTYRDAEAGLPYIDEVTRIVLTDQTAQETAFRGEQLHVYYTPPPEIADRIAEDLGDQITVVEYTSLSPVQSTMSSHREWTQDIRMREATYRTHDLQQFIDLILDGRGEPNLSMVQGGLTPYQLDPSETESYRVHDPEQARQLFEAGGFDFDLERELPTRAVAAAATKRPSRSSRSSSARSASTTSPTRWSRPRSSSRTSRARARSTGASGPTRPRTCRSACCV